MLFKQQSKSAKHWATFGSHILFSEPLMYHTLSALTWHWWLPPAPTFGCSFRYNVACVSESSPAAPSFITSWFLDATAMVCASGCFHIKWLSFPLPCWGHFCHCATRMHLWSWLCLRCRAIACIVAMWLWVSPHLLASVSRWRAMTDHSWDDVRCGRWCQCHYTILWLTIFLAHRRSPDRHWRGVVGWMVFR